MVTFNAVPNSRVPFVFVEFDASNAVSGPRIKPYTLLVVGQRIAAGTIAELVPQLVTSADDAAIFFGKGSQLHGMAESLFQNNRTTPAYFVAQDDDGTGVAGQKTITVTGTASASGTVYLYVAGRRIRVAVPTGSANNAIAAAIDAALVAVVDTLPYTSAVATNVVTLTAKNAGEESESLDVRINYAEGELLPAGVTSIAIASSVTGANNPDVADIWAVLGETQYDVIACAYSDATNYTELDRELADRWGPLRQNEGVAIIARSDTHANLITYGSTKNSKHISTTGITASPSPRYEWAAATAGQVALHGQQDPARPFQTLPLTGILAPSPTDRFTFQELDLLLNGGIATFFVSASGSVTIGRQITGYLTNAIGAVDTAFLDIQTPLTLGFLRWDFVNRIQLKYSRHKLADDGTRFAAGQKVITPALGKAEAVAIFRDWESQGLVEGFDQFKADVIVERNPTDPNRLDYYLPTDLLNQLRVTGAQIGFKL